MRSSFTALTQSKFYSPALNSAIYDGPVRIYFAQFHEALALKIYFMIQQGLTEEMARAKEVSKALGANILIMIYPTEESFLMSFETAQNNQSVLEIEKLEDDIVIGLRGPIADDKIDILLNALKDSMENWRPASQAASSASLEL